MKNKIVLIIVIIVLIILMIPFWINETIPKQIAKIYGTNYMKSHYPKMELEYDGIVWSKYHGDYLISFKDKDNQSYTCVIGPKYFPVFIGQGEFVISETYKEKFSEK